MTHLELIDRAGDQAFERLVEGVLDTERGHTMMLARDIVDDNERVFVVDRVSDILTTSFVAIEDQMASTAEAQRAAGVHIVRFVTAREVVS